MLPPGFRDNPHFFSTALEKDLWDLSLGKRSILQYVDDLICRPIKEESDENTFKVLNSLIEQGYKISKTKAQISLQQVQYLAHILTPGTQ